MIPWKIQRECPVRRGSAGRKGAGEELFPLVYRELHDLAGLCMRRQRPGHTLQTTALVHEAYLKLGGDRNADWESRGHFLRVAARAMRSVLVDHDRRKRARKRGGDQEREPLVAAAELTEDPTHDLIDLDQALNRLAEMDPQTAEVVELRFFGGLTREETARVMKIAPRTVTREWTLAKAWLKNYLTRDEPDQSP